MRHVAWSSLLLWAMGAAIAGCPGPERAKEETQDPKDSGGVGVVDSSVDSLVLDAGRLDRTGTDSARLDSARPDLTGVDTVGMDLAAPDAGAADSAAPDRASSDTAAPDLAGRDLTGVDTSRPDTASNRDTAIGQDTTPPDAGLECTSDRQCAAGYICVNDVCVTGCHVAEDCPTEAPICDTTVQPNGQCVQCLEGGDCRAPADLCIDHVCLISCDQVDQCPRPNTCALDLGYCVRCTEDAQCPRGSICEANACVVGCHEDSQCGDGMICENLSCLFGCRADPDTCPEDYHCDVGSHQCAIGCGTSDSQCADNEVCLDNACVPRCEQDDNCPTETHCDTDAGLCVPGCSEATCDWGTVCDPSDGACVQCFEGATDYCTRGQICDLLNRTCTMDCDTSSEWCTRIGWHCDPDRDNLCVECLEDTHCGYGELCLSDLGVCTPAGDGLPLCAACADDAACGGAADLCVVRTYGFFREQVCGVACDNACPQGTACQDVLDELGRVRGRQCLPASQYLTDNHSYATCRAYVDTVQQKRCSRNYDCGLLMQVSVQDGICSTDGTYQDRCSMFCSMDNANDCPEGFVCEDPPRNNNSDPAPRCAAVP